MADRLLPKSQRAEIAVIRRQLRAIDRLAEETIRRGHEIHRRLWAMENGPMRDAEPTEADSLKTLVDLKREWEVLVESERKVDGAA